MALTVRDNIFISYRRDDARGASGRLYDWFRIAFGREHVFRDVHSIGVCKWRDKIDDALALSAVCVAVVGPRWANETNLPRLHDEGDMVRHELVTALNSSDLALVPTLVEGADIPKVADLPAALRPLFSDWNVRRVTEDGWEDDTRRLIDEIATTARLVSNPDVDTLVRDYGAAQERATELERTQRLQADQIEALRQSIVELRTKLAEAPMGERPQVAAAFAGLARGDSAAAEDTFEREFERQSVSVAGAFGAMAEAARNVANLALMRDVTKAADFYRKALVIEPGHAETARHLGQALLLLGNVSEARAAFTQSLAAARSAGDRWEEMAAFWLLGDIHGATGDLTAAQAAFGRARELAEQWLSREPANTDSQRAVAISYDRIGNVLMKQGDGPGALAAYRQSGTLIEELAARDADSGRWQHELSLNHNKIAEVLLDQGDVPGALAAYRHGLAAVEALIARHPANTEFQRDLSFSHLRIGDALNALGDGRAAFAAYRRSADLRAVLAVRDPANTQGRRDLSTVLERIGGMLPPQKALAFYRQSHALTEELAARDPDNTDWQRDLSISHNNIGDELMELCDLPGALAAYRKSYTLAEALATRDQVNAQWQRDLSISHRNIGDVLAAQGDGGGALAAYRQTLAVAEALNARDPANAQWRIDVAIVCAKLGILDYDELKTRREYLIRAQSILLALKTEGRLIRMRSGDWLGRVEQQLKELPMSLRDGRDR